MFHFILFPDVFNRRYVGYLVHDPSALVGLMCQFKLNVSRNATQTRQQPGHVIHVASQHILILAVRQPVSATTQSYIADFIPG